MNPDRVRFHQSGDDAAAEVLTDAVAMVGRAAEAGSDIATARAAQTGDDAWSARLLLVEATGASAPALTQLLRLVEDHPGGTGTCIVLTSGGEHDAPGAVLDVTADGRLRIPHAGVDLLAVGLSGEEARGCAALLAQSEDLRGVEIPDDGEATDGWRSYANQAGALRREHIVPRHAPTDDIDEPVQAVLDAADERYLDAAATTADDLQALSPRVPVGLRPAVEQADPTLDDDVAAWLSEDCDLPRLALLGPVGARTGGLPVSKRKPYYTELLAYLATRPHGATPEEVADAFSITLARVRNDVKVVRDWLGVNPRTGRKHLPDAREAPAAQARGIGVYQVEDLLTDADLFRRLRVRGEARGADGITDLRQALTLVTGQPFDKLRPGGWAWLVDGDRLDQHLLCAVVDVAHIVTTHDIQAGDLPRARAAAELAALAAPYEEIPRLDLAAVAAAQGHHQEAEQILRDHVCNRSDDDGPPMELPDRTQHIIDNHGWLRHGNAAS